MATVAAQPSFSGFLKASGQAEVWDDTDVKKFQQFGWRSTTNESSYSTGTLVGNWSEEKFDSKEIFKSKPLSSQYNHYFETTYKDGYCGRHKKITHQRTGSSKVTKAYPGHQPELDPPEARMKYSKPFLTTSQEAYGVP